MDGRMRVYHATLPQRSGARSVLLRVLSETKAYLTIRLTALPGSPPLRQRNWTVAREDLDVMVTVKLAKPISTLRCSSCSSTMSLYEGRIGKRQGVFFACSGCEECLEV